MTTAEGGMVLAPERSVLESIRHLRAHGMTSNTLDRHRGHAYTYDVTKLGYNYRMDELRAAIGLVQLERLPKWNARRRELSSYYRRYLAEEVPEVSVPFDHRQETAAHLMPVLLKNTENRARIMEKMRLSGIQTSIHYPPVHHFSFYQERYRNTKLPFTDRYFAQELTLPLHPALSEREVERVVKALRNAVSVE